jgi:hypothetical protein
MSFNRYETERMGAVIRRADQAREIEDGGKV